MKKKKETALFSPEHIIEGILDIVKNKPDALSRFVTDLLNINYDFSNRTGFYKILSSEQIAGLHKIHELRKRDKEFDQNFQVFVLSASVAVGVGYIISELAG